MKEERLYMQSYTYYSLFSRAESHKITVLCSGHIQCSWLPKPTWLYIPISLARAPIIEVRHQGASSRRVIKTHHRRPSSRPIIETHHQGASSRPIIEACQGQKQGRKWGQILRPRRKDRDSESQCTVLCGERYINQYANLHKSQPCVLLTLQISKWM